MHQNSSDPLIVASIYLQPDFDKQNFVTLLNDFLYQKHFIGKKVILVSDFNINWNKNSREKQDIHQCLTSAGLQQVLVGTSFISNHAQVFGFENKGVEALSFRQVYGCFFRLPTSGSDGVKTVVCR